MRKVDDPTVAETPEPEENATQSNLPTRISPPEQKETEDGTQLLGPDGEPIAQGAPTEDAGGDSAPPTEAGRVDAGDRAKKAQSPGRPLSLYPLPVWPD